MMNQRPFESTAPVSAEEMSAFVDNELCAEDRERVRAGIQADAALAQQVCAFDQIQDWLREAYRAPPVPPSRRRISARGAGALAWLPVTAAACGLLCVGALFGWLVAKQMGVPSAIPGSVLAARALPAVVDARHVLVRWGSDAPQKAQESLEMVKTLLAQSANEPDFRLEVLANADGVRLLSAEDSPYAAEIEELARKYPNVRFLACGNSMKTLEKTGKSLRLLPHVQITPSAVEQVANRVREGWAYLSI